MTGIWFQLNGPLRQVRHGKSLLVMPHDQVVAEIHPPSKEVTPRRRPGALAGKIHMADDFDLLPRDVLDARPNPALHLLRHNSESCRLWPSRQPV